MTNPSLLDAPCVHGVVWYECEECVEQIDPPKDEDEDE